MDAFNPKRKDRPGMSVHIQRLEVYPRTPEKAQGVLRAWAYHVQSSSLIARSNLEEVFVDPIVQITVERPRERPDLKDFAFVVEVSFKPGVTDNSGKSASEALALTGVKAQVATRTLTFFDRDWDRTEVERLSVTELGNPLIQDIKLRSIAEFIEGNPFLVPRFPEVSLSSTGKLVETVSFNQTLDELEAFSKERTLALSREELQFLKETFSSAEWMQKRKEQNMPMWPTDVEVEIIAQTWSEHCKHKIFQAQIDYSEAPNVELPLGSFKVDGLYPSYIKKTTKELNQPWLISVFSDNAGIVRFDEKIDACIKVETHNSPSALDPYGGALTGILGVNRDIMGTGLGARPVANMDVFCFAPPTWPKENQESFMPQGLMEPRQLLKGVHKGVEDGGNKSGIPTVNGAIHFDADYAGKPLVFVGTVGVMPQTMPSGYSTAKKRTQIGDKIVVIGGAVGADGIHGATFSSLELDENAPATAVQIGDPLTQKRVMDLLLEARERELYTGITDNGAGGLSSSLGEMSTLTNGARFDLALNPTKYPGLAPFELMISESQERMSLSVAPDKVDEFLDLCRRRNVDAHVLGEFTDSGYLEVLYEGSPVALLDLHFLHEALPKMKLKALWHGPRERLAWMPEKPKTKFNSIQNALNTLLSSPNIASKERFVRQYDHEVQGATVMKPFAGTEGLGPSDAGGIWLKPHGGSDEGVLLISNGLAPRLSLVDPYLMACMAVDEAIRALVVAGGDPEHWCLLDNFCWPDPVQSAKNPDGDRKLAELVRTCHGLREACLAYRAPLVSGKDSMKNDFRGKNKKGDDLVISILPTLLVTGLAKSELKHLVTTPFKRAGDMVICLGNPHTSLLASEYSEYFIDSDPAKVEIDLELNARLYKAFSVYRNQGRIRSAHDLSDGGLLVALAESLIGASTGLGVRLNPRALEGIELTRWCFGEGAGRLLVSIDPHDLESFRAHFSGLPFEEIGVVTEDARLELEVSGGGESLCATQDELRKSFTGGVFA
jgi:phosphoribosylformylglycinamidine synthase subunit PurSL